MKEINKLVDLVTNRLKSNFDVIDLSGSVPNPGKEQQLYNGVLDKKYPNDESAASGMYNSDIYDQRFRMLKSRLRYKLYDLLYYLDFDDANFSETNRVKLECIEYLHKSTILVYLKEYGMAEKQINKAITLAESFQLTTITMKAFEIMRGVHAKMCRPTDLELTLGRLKKLRILYAFEEEANDIFYEMSMLLSKSIHSRDTNIDKAKSVSLQLKGLWKKTNSFNIYEQYYKLAIWHALLENDYKSVLKILSEVDSIVAKMSLENGRLDTGYNNYITAKAYLNLGEYKKGFEVAKSSLKQLDRSANLWFDQSELYFIMAMHNKNFKLADKILTSVLKNPNYKRIVEEKSERWKLFRVYLNFADLGANRLKRVRFNDTYKAANHYFKELKGYYISLPILEFIHLLKKGNTEMALSKLKEVDNYFYKHLNEPGKNQREKQFFKLLKTLKSNNYIVEDTVEKTGDYIEKMTGKKLNKAFSDYEIIPYEDLWKIMLGVVKGAKMRKSQS